MLFHKSYISYVEIKSMCAHPPPPDIFQAFTSSNVPRVGHFLFVDCPMVGDFSDSSITFTKHTILAMKNCILPKQNVCANTHTHAIYSALNLTLTLLYKKEIFYVL